MNWLAHALLSEANPEFQLGNLVADMIKGPAREGLPPELLRGMACHQSIDGFTDKHPVVFRSRARISPTYRRYSGILIDIFYDHVLAREFEHYQAEPLSVFTRRLYDNIGDHTRMLPLPARSAMRAMIDYDLLGSYSELEGIEEVLQRISQRLEVRLGIPLTLDRSISDLSAHYDALAQDFAEFFPDLQAHVRQWPAASGKEQALRKEEVSGKQEGLAKQNGPRILTPTTVDRD